MEALLGLGGERRCDARMGETRPPAQHVAHGAAMLGQRLGVD